MGDGRATAFDADVAPHILRIGNLALHAAIQLRQYCRQARTTSTPNPGFLCATHSNAQSTPKSLVRFDLRAASSPRAEIMSVAPKRRAKYRSIVMCANEKNLRCAETFACRDGAKPHGPIADDSHCGTFPNICAYCGVDASGSTSVSGKSAGIIALVTLS